MKTILLRVVLALAVALLLCLAANAVEKIPVRTLAKGAFSGITTPKQEVIKDQAAWEKFWNAHHAKAKSAPKLPAVDFGKEMIIAVTMGRKNSGGYSVEITGVAAAANRLRVSVKQTLPKPGAMVITALTAPFHFVAVPKSDLPAEFVETPSVEKSK